MGTEATNVEIVCASIRKVDGNWYHCNGGAGHDGDHHFEIQWTTAEEYVPPPPPPTLEEQIARLRTRFPDAQLLPHKHGWYTVKFTLPLPKGKYNRESTWVAFDVPPGFPASHPENFLTDPDLRFSYGGWLPRTSEGIHPMHEIFGEPKREWGSAVYAYPINVQVVHGHVQMWNPNHSTIFTYAMVVKHAIETGLGWRKT